MEAAFTRQGLQAIPFPQERALPLYEWSNGLSKPLRLGAGATGSPRSRVDSSDSGGFDGMKERSAALA